MSDERSSEDLIRQLKLVRVPEQPSGLSSALRLLSFHTLSAFLVAPVLLFYAFTRPRELWEILDKARRPSIKGEKYYQDPALVEKLLRMLVAQSYLRGGLEYQVREGFCASATLRCKLRSMAHIITGESVPAVQGGSSVPRAVSEKIDAAGRGRTRTSVLYGAEGYAAFLTALRRANDVRYRVSVNFLRSPLFGFASLLPFHVVLALFGGHFSPVLGYLEEEDLVAVFDVNHTYGGIYFVSSRRLYDAVHTPDLSQRPGTVRGLVVTEIVAGSEKESNDESESGGEAAKEDDRIAPSQS